MSAVYETQLGALDLADAALFERAQQALADYREATCEPLESMARERAAELRLIGRTRSGP